MQKLAAIINERMFIMRNERDDTAKLTKRWTFAENKCLRTNSNVKKAMTSKLRNIFAYIDIFMFRMKTKKSWCGFSYFIQFNEVEWNELL